MQLGDYDVQYRGSDGSIIIRWRDPYTKKHLAHILHNPNELFEGLLEKIFADRTQVVKLFESFQINTLDFLDGPDSYMLSPAHNTNMVEEKYTNLANRWQSTPDQIWEWDVASFVYAYNTYHNKKIDYKDVLPLVQYLRKYSFY